MSGSWNKRYGSIPKATQEIVIESFAPTLAIHKPAGKFPSIQKRRWKTWYHVDNKFNPTTIIDIYVRAGMKNEWMILNTNPTFDATVDFSVNTNPNTAWTTFNPNTPNLTTVLYVSTIDWSQWTWNGTSYVSAPVSPDWKITGNAWTIQATNFIGTTDNVGLSVRTNNVIRQTITNNGNIGIGTTTPTTLLNVQNTASTSANVALFKSLNGAWGYAVRWESVNAWWALWVYWELWAWDWTRRSWVRGNSSLFTAPAITWFSTIPNWLSAFFNERVWVWTQTPESDLHVVGSVSNSITVINATTTLNDTHNKIVVQNWAANITITLPNALTCVWRVYEISRYAWSTWSITVVGSWSQIQALAWTVWATTTLWIHWAAGQWLRHSFTAANVWGVWVRVRL